MTDTTHSDSSTTHPFGEDSVGYDPTTGTFHARFDGDPKTLVVTIVEAVGTVTNCDPVSMPPLFETINPEALTNLLISTRETDIEVTFEYEGCHVTASSHGSIVVEPLEE
ncbi:HalOD1 output domain-containing protein [Natronorubrum sp. A-ect3]|uniref:HalOD1 output domain-containing protein n=1 Tax=Natronorubrum sp. A-ect3 TaxID=3242698 RepID=UPI00359EDD59